MHVLTKNPEILLDIVTKRNFFNFEERIYQYFTSDTEKHHISIVCLLLCPDIFHTLVVKLESYHEHFMWSPKLGLRPTPYGAHSKR